MDHKTEQDAGLLEQAASMLEEHAEEQRTRGNCSAAEGAACSAHAIRRLAPAMLRAGRGCLAQIEEQAGPARIVVDDNWKARMLDGRAIERDAQGLGEHPDLPWLDEGMNPPKFFEALGLQLAGVSAQDQLEVDAYDAMAGNYDAKEFNFSAWAPASPEGADWRLVSIHDTEDGPVAWWLRELPYAAATRPVRRARERDDLTVDECREYLHSGWTRVRGRTEQALMLQLCEALEAGPATAAGAGPALVWPDTCDGKEQEAFEAWAKQERYSMEQHPMFYLFLNKETAAARDAWRAGLLYAVAQMKARAAPALEAPAAPAKAGEHYDELRATLTGLHALCENISRIERRVGPLGSHARGYTHKITKALRHLDALAAAPQAPAKGLPYEPTSDMLNAGRACDPALPLDTVRAIWWSMWRTAPQAPAAPVPVPAQADPAALLQLAELLESGRSLIQVERKEAADALRLQAAAAPAAPAVDADPMAEFLRDTGPAIVWPKARDVGRIGDMNPSAHLRIGLDSDNDVYASIWDERGGGAIEFCTPGSGGGKSSRTRMALLAVMVAMEADNAADPRRDWWAERNGAAQAQQKGPA